MEPYRYGVKPWIEALLDNEPVVPSDHRKRSITPPPPFFRPAESDAGSVASSTAPPSAGTRRRATRSMSPGKRIMTPRKSRASKAAKDSPLKKEMGAILETEETTKTITASEPAVLASTALASAVANGPSVTTPVKKEGATFKVEVDEEVQTTEDGETKITHVKVELPAGESPSIESTEDMIEKARAMVIEARKVDGDFTPVAKRKMEIEDVEEQDQSEEEDEEESEERKAKRTKVLEDQLRREKVKNRALLGLSATLAIGWVPACLRLAGERLMPCSALLPYVL